MSRPAEPIVGHYPGWEVLKEQDHWDPATRRLVLDRVYNIPRIHFFSPQEVQILQAAVDAVMPQDDRAPERRVPIVAYIDESLYKGETPGYRYEDMPEDRTAWHWGLQGIEQASREIFDGRRLAELGPAERREVFARIQKGDAPGEVWQRMPAQRFFAGILMGAVVSAYYGHPYAWNEIGYGGPAYPRGYYGLNHGSREHWEVPERR